MTRNEVYKLIQDFLINREENDIPLIKDGLLVSRAEGDYIIKVIKKKS